MSNKLIPFDELKSCVQGELYTDRLRKVMLSTDAGLYQIEPAALLYPKNTQDVVSAVIFAGKYNLPVHPRGAGSGLCGSAIGHGIVIDFTKFMNTLKSFNPDKLTFTCEPGYRCGELEQLLADTGIFFPPAPSSGEYATFGGMYGTNAGGAYSVKYGNTADYLIDAEIVFADGFVHTLNDIASAEPAHLSPAFYELFKEIAANRKLISSAYPDLPCNVCGYDLRNMAEKNRLRLHKLFGGSEGTLGIVTEMTFRLRHKPKFSALIVAYFNDIVSSAKAAQLALAEKPAGIEIMDKSLLKIAAEHEPSLKGGIPEGYDNVLLMEFESDRLQNAENTAKKCMKEIAAQNLSPEISLALTTEEAERFHTVRKAAVPILYLLKGKKRIIPMIEDSAIPADKLVAYFRGLYKIFEEHGVNFVLYGHIAKGLLHTRPLLDMKDRVDIKHIKPITDAVFNLVHGLGGTISGEHGDGRIRSFYIPMQYHDIYDIFLQVKKLLDPKNIFNPDIKTHNDPQQIINDLRYGANYNAAEPPDKLLIWENGIAYETERCHGCSKCTTVTSATRMCPAYKSTRDEASAPKAKANILRALVSGRIENREIYQKQFQSVINRCFNCGNCSYECPSHVDIPKLVLEARSQYARRFGSPLEHKIVTWLDMLAIHSRKFFPFITPLMRLKSVRKLAEKTTGIETQRDLLKISRRSLYDRFGTVTGGGDKKALYFAGCYASYVRPEIGESAIRVLNRLGYRVLLPDQRCCGIPHAAKGMAENVRQKIEDNLKNWRGLLDEADVIAVSCSSCALSLTKEWGFYIGGELIDRVKKMTVHISALIDESMTDINLKSDGLSLAYHASCHTKLLPDSAANLRMFSKVQGINMVSLKNSCCGMAGSWGMSAKNYKESVKIGAGLAASLMESECGVCVTDCPTCEMQLKHLSGKNVFHPVEIIDKVLAGFRV
ncbi:MAG: FAD-binding protein [Deferribacteraceae bacterium]|jgi:FAD/FMN-containing dehydrogenase/Fe-S oxidoreductase|nr:FAD-binding protein [Deferribacteraceae bacterium]